MAARKSTGQRLRFEIFKRDGFRCVYCGATPVDGPLHVDHVEAVANGGSDDPANLVTACACCNLGKSSVPLEAKALGTPVLTEADLDHAQQIREYLSVQRDVARAKDAVSDEMANYWEERCGALIPGDLLPRLPGLVQEWGVEALMQAFNIVGRKFQGRSGTAPVKYLYGILRKWRETGVTP